MKKLISVLLLFALLCCSTALASDKYDLDDYGYRYVDTKGRGSLVFQKAPRGKSIPGFKYYTGDKIYVNLYWRSEGYAMAYEDGTYGYVDASYINWGSGSSSSSSSSSASIPSYVKDLDDFAYRRVRSNGRGSLVFQKAPRGKSMSGHRFYDGDWIYVNVDYRKEGYAVAYEDGEYGYVDASYIDWSSSKSSSSSSSSSSGIPSSAKNLSNFEWREVDSDGRGSLVFQKAPRGKSMSGHKFYDGDWIYVNVNYRKEGYAIAYEDGEYGYVDASYIDW